MDPLGFGQNGGRGCGTAHGVTIYGDTVEVKVSERDRGEAGVASAARVSVTTLLDNIKKKRDIGCTDLQFLLARIGKEKKSRQ